MTEHDLITHAAATIYAGAIAGGVDPETEAGQAALVTLSVGTAIALRDEAARQLRAKHRAQPDHAFAPERRLGRDRRVRPHDTQYPEGRRSGRQRRRG